jgi:hypothetical protein
MIIDLIHLPRKVAGVSGVQKQQEEASRLPLAVDLIHLPRKVAGVFGLQKDIAEAPPLL